jgi:hypothetical protein
MAVQLADARRVRSDFKGEVIVDGGAKARVDEILNESDPKRRLALARRLRVEIWNLLDREDRARLEQLGLGNGPNTSAVREVK